MSLMNGEADAVFTIMEACLALEAIMKDQVEQLNTIVHIIYLICASNARVLTKSVKIHQSEGIPDPGIPERPFVKFAHRCSLASSRRIFFIFSRAVFYAAP